MNRIHHFSNLFGFSAAYLAKRWMNQIQIRHNQLKFPNTGGNGWLFGFSLSGLFWSTKTGDYNGNITDFMAEPITPKDELLEKAKNGSMQHRFELFVMQVQHEFCRALESMEAKYTDEIDDSKVKRFLSDRWIRAEGGGGITCIMQDSSVFEKAGVNISVVHGMLPPPAVQQMRARGKDLSATEPLHFFAAGVSSVVHPRNPNVPTLHFNFRYFEVEPNKDKQKSQWWFGGGTDMTPYFLDEDDARLFHGELKKACDQHDRSYYGRFKKWCDDYFYIKHRDERRGIGGLFFDDIDYPDQERAFAFVQSCARSLVPAYIPIVDKNARKGYSLADRQWQLLRRGRYVEFNLIYDRGTKFGLMTPGARYESILMSLPLVARWEYQHQPKPGTKESALMEVLKNPRDWV